MREIDQTGLQRRNQQGARIDTLQAEEPIVREGEKLFAMSDEDLIILAAGLTIAAEHRRERVYDMGLSTATAERRRNFSEQEECLQELARTIFDPEAESTDPAIKFFELIEARHQDSAS